jgi:Na+/H+ antiporter NhaD/arsenite permease-like protein
MVAVLDRLQWQIRELRANLDKIAAANAAMMVELNSSNFGRFRDNQTRAPQSPHPSLDAKLEFVIFGLTLLGVALFHRRAFIVALGGLVAAILLRFLEAPAAATPTQEIATHFADEGVILTNLLLLLLGFAIVSNQFEKSNLPEAIPSLLPDGWMGGVTLLAIAFCLSIFLDNIAGAIIGGVAARHVYRHGVTIGFQAAIVSAANAGGAGSVIGDTTTTMMWIKGISPLELLPAFIGAIAAFAVFAPLAAIGQQKHSPVIRCHIGALYIEWSRALIVAIILATLVAVNVIANSFFRGLEERAPALGLGLWVAILITAPLRAPDWKVLREAAKGALFLVTLVALASLMPVDRLPPPSLLSVFGLGLLSAVFDNIPLTALALKQGWYDWALLAYAVGFGGSIMWFGSSAGVALTNLYPEGRSVVTWLRYGWHVPLAYIVGFLAIVFAPGSR